MIPSDDLDDALPDPRMLRLFDVLHRTRSVTRSAEQLGWSQSTVSTWLAKLRREFDDPLFVRTPSGMQPTHWADALIKVCRASLGSLRLLVTKERGFDPAEARHLFRICMTDASHVTLLPRLLVFLQRYAPAVRLEALRIGGETAGSLLAGDADIAVGLLPELDAGFYGQTLYTQDWICLARGDHPRARCCLDLATYVREAHVAIASGASRRLLDDALQKAGISRRVVLELPGFLGLGPILTDSDLIATLPRFIGESLGASASLSVFTCPLDVPHFQVKQYWHGRVHNDAGHRWLRGVCAKLFTRAAGGEADAKR